MGSYLSKPITEKVSTNQENDKLKSGASSMQGWRVTQEDAHNCLLDFDVNTALFAVYDGHGGHEVAQYCSLKLPQYIKDTDAYKNADLEKALIDAFLGFDATIASQEIIEELKQIAGVKDGDNDSDSSDVEENVSNLCAEATMPLEQVIEKYTSNLKNSQLHKLHKEGEKHPVSPYLRPQKDFISSTEPSSSSSGGSPKTSKISSAETEDNKCDSSKENNSASSSITEASSSIPDPENKEETNSTVTNTDESKDATTETNSKSSQDQPNQNGEITSTEKNNDKSPSIPQENGDINKKGKGKVTAKTKGIPEATTTQIRRSARQLYSKLLEMESESDSEDEEDKTFQGPSENSSSDDLDDDADEDNSKAEKDNSEASSEEEEEEDLDDLDDLDDEEDECELDEADLDFARNMREGPGSDSGCTAVVALLRGNQLYVANAGDSRCIVCRNGKAVEMSIDHKPEDELEHERVVKAGGHVTADGRVNGGLNLSRAIGDHAYKQKKELSDREQMITALPDVRTLTLKPGEDEFMVLACDGIWNFMSSQQVVDFVRPKIQEFSDNLSKICEEMFDYCLAPNTLGDGTGCDNMTGIIVQFKNTLCKRPAPLESDEPSENIKRAKTDEPTIESDA